MHPEYSTDLGFLWTLSSHGAVLRVLHVVKSNPAEMETNQHSERHQNGEPISTTFVRVQPVANPKYNRRCEPTNLCSCTVPMSLQLKM